MTYKKWSEKNNNGETIITSEIDYDCDCHAYGITNVTTGVTIGTICPPDVAASDAIRDDLNSGESVDGMEDGFGHTVNIDG